MPGEIFVGGNLPRDATPKKGFVTSTKAARSTSRKESNVMPLRQPSAILR
jgi:hypothetical protein